MNNDDISIFESLERHQVFNVKNAVLTAKVDGYNDKQLIMDNALAVITEGNKVQNAGGVTDSKTVKKMKKNMAKTITDYVEGAVILANAANETALADNINKSYSSILQASKANAVSKAKAIRKLFFDKSTIITNVKAPELILIDAAIEGYDSIKDLPITQIKQVKSHGTDPISVAVVVGRKASVDQYGLFHSHYQYIEVEITDELKLLHTPIYTGYIKTPLIVSIVDDTTGLGIDNAVMSKDVKNGTKSFKSGNGGLIPFDTHKAGETEYTVVAKDFKTTKDSVKVIRHENNTVEIRLKPLD